jgi:hypothetical protein
MRVCHQGYAADCEGKDWTMQRQTLPWTIDQYRQTKELEVQARHVQVSVSTRSTSGFHLAPIGSLICSTQIRPSRIAGLLSSTAIAKRSDGQPMAESLVRTMELAMVASEMKLSTQIE